MSKSRPILVEQRSVDELLNFLALDQSVFSQAALSTKILGITSDSLAVEAGDLFVALPGAHRHGAEFANDAVARGAVAILTDTKGAQQISLSLPIIVIDSPRRMLGALSSWFYRKPSRAMLSVGITGTNGKTTTSSLLAQLWELAGREVGIVGTTGISIAREEFPARFTTPEAPELQQIMATMRERHVTHNVMEVSSHALEQMRISGTGFAMVGFTNLTQDHLDFHGTMENYFRAKSRLFTVEYADAGFINIDDSFGVKLLEISEIPVTTLSRENTQADWHYTAIEQRQDGYDISLRGSGGVLIESRLPLIGDHNLDNALMAIALACETGIDPLDIAQLLPRLRGVRGRLEQVAIGQNFLALVDYAHTPDAVSRTLATLRSSTPGKLIALLGCGGDRDKSKRPIMGQALQAGADIAIFTSDNPRSEEALDILNDMTATLSLKESSVVEVDRRTAIALAVTSAESGDTVVLLGKGHELGQEIHGVKYPFDDVAELARAIEELS